MYKDRHMEKFKRVMRHIKLISMNRRLLQALSNSPTV
jgi:hypothetical protein